MSGILHPGHVDSGYGICILFTWALWYPGPLLLFTQWKVDVWFGGLNHFFLMGGLRGEVRFLSNPLKRRAVILA